MNRTIFIANKGAHDYSRAEKYGTLVFVTQGRVNPLDTTSMYEAWLHVLKNSAPCDFIVLNGPSTLNAIGVGVFAHMHRRINLLLYKNLEYRPREIILE